MSDIQTALDQLSSQYTTSAAYYLSNFFAVDGSKTLYKFLRSLYSAEYANDYRILIVQDCVDQYPYADLPGLALTALQKNLRELDISNFFVTVVSANPNIGQELEQVRQLYSTDQCCMNHVQLSGSYTKKIAKQDTFCPLPWMHLYIGPDGNVLPCCVADQQFPLGNINEQSIDSIVKSSKFTTLRQNMLAGTKSKECQRCYLQEDSGLPSSRHAHRSRWSMLPDKLDANGLLDKFEPRYLDIRLNNICNLKCRMCSGYFSSAIAQEEFQIFANTSSVDMTLHREQRNLVLQEIIEYLPFAEKIYFAGGEPLLAPEHYEILHQLIDCNNTNVEILYSTNLTTLQYKNFNVVDIWQQFSNIHVMASIDAHGSVAQYVRHGCDWSDIESNLQTVTKHCAHVKLSVNSTVSLLTVASLIELQQSWHDRGMLDISKFSMSVLLGPEHLSVCALPAHHKTRLTELINQHIQWCQRQKAMALVKSWQHVIAHMQSQDLSHSLAEFKRLTQQMDGYRRESLIATMPEYADLLA